MPYDNPRQVPYDDIGILTAARARIADRDHWGQRRFRDGARCCLLEALAGAIKSANPDNTDETERRLQEILVANLPRSTGLRARMKFLSSRYRLIVFNDLFGTYHDDAVELFDHAIKNLLNNKQKSVAEQSNLEKVA